MAKCKCGKELLQGEKKCERCVNKGRETRKKIVETTLGVLLLVGTTATSIVLKGKGKK